jgi:O-antigen/teichoic acid export membrane protein
LTIWNYSWPFSVFGVFTWVQLSSDRWALQLLATPSDVGLYAVLFQLGYSPTSTVSAMLTQFVAPIIYAKAGDATDSTRNAEVAKLTWHLVNVLLAITCVVCLAAWWLHGQLFRAFVAPRYWSASRLLPWIVLAAGIFSAGQIVALKQMSRLRTRAIMRAKVTTALFGVVSNVAGAYWLGMPGVVYAGVAFSIAYFVWLAWFVPEHERIATI